MIQDGEGSNPSFCTNNDLSGEMGGTINTLGRDDIETIAHELFHAYQDENGQGGASIFNEVEANLFGYSAALQYASENYYPFGSSAPMGKENTEGINYEGSFKNLLNSNTFSRENFDTAVQNFKSGSMRNESGGYNNYPLQRSNQKTSLISRFYPLLK